MTFSAFLATRSAQSCPELRTGVELGLADLVCRQE